MLHKVKRNRKLIVLLLPIVIAVFFAGWLMYVAGRQGSGSAPKDTKSKKEQQQ